MISLEESTGHGFYLQRLNQVRNLLIELRRGTAEYRALESAPGVFAVERNYNGKTSVVLINFSPREKNVSLTVPDSLAKGD